MTCTDRKLDYDIAERRGDTGDALLRRARARSAAHRFADALADIAAAERVGAHEDEVAAIRASILVSIGRAVEALPQLEARVSRHPGFASHGALASAYAALGRLVDADRMYVAALDDLDTTSPFPFAWLYFARGLMWAEQGGDRAAAQPLFERALQYLPAFAAANIHLAQIEISRGRCASAMQHLEVAATTEEPEALSLQGELHVRLGDSARGWRENAHARRRFDSLLANHPQAFADHAAEFYLGPGADPERAWVLANQNLAERHTDRAFALAAEAARATGRTVPGR
jgi:tetratricopeptide (TPR) repeat protein